MHTISSPGQPHEIVHESSGGHTEHHCARRGNRLHALGHSNLLADDGCTPAGIEPLSPAITYREFSLVRSCMSTSPRSRIAAANRAVSSWMPQRDQAEAENMVLRGQWRTEDGL
jgi:hypothetical protein